MRKALAFVLICAVSVGGCATKRYGRMQPLSAAEMRVYDCDDIEVELSKIEAFQDAIDEGAKINAASALGFLADYGIGNKMEKDAAEKSARDRKRELQALAGTKGCATA